MSVCTGSAEDDVPVHVASKLAQSTERGSNGVELDLFDLNRGTIGSIVQEIV